MLDDAHRHEALGRGADRPFIYWEGAVKTVGEHAGNGVSGNGYVELTGYAHSMQGQL
jgi:predicted secreted hydrolase